MYIYNITFVTSPDKEIELLNYLRNRIIPTVVVSKYPANNPELRKVIETGGEKPSPEHGVSIAFSAAFPTEEVAHLWHDEILMPALADFHLKFGEQGLFFVTLLENLSLQDISLVMENTSDFDRIIMGIDPGTNVMGYGILGVKGKSLTPLMLGGIELHKVGDHYLRLARIYERVTGLIEQYLPDELAIEAPFYGKNVQSMLKLGRAQGVAMAAALARDIPIAEYAPLKVKQVVTGNGGASKEQVANMLCYILKLQHDKLPGVLDATDAMAVALTHYYESVKPTAAQGAKNWEQFLKQHPERIIKK